RLILDQVASTGVVRVQLEVAPRRGERAGRGVNADDRSRAAGECGQRKTARIAVKVKHASIPRELLGGSAILALVEEIAGLLSMIEVNGKADSVFYRDAFDRGIAREQADTVGQALLATDCTLAALENGARGDEAFESRNDLVAHPIGPASE